MAAGAATAAAERRESREIPFERKWKKNNNNNNKVGCNCRHQKGAEKVSTKVFEVVLSWNQGGCGSGGVYVSTTLTAHHSEGVILC